MKILKDKRLKWASNLLLFAAVAYSVVDFPLSPLPVATDALLPPEEFLPYTWVYDDEIELNSSNETDGRDELSILILSSTREDDIHHMNGIINIIRFGNSDSHDRFYSHYKESILPKESASDFQEVPSQFAENLVVGCMDYPQSEKMICGFTGQYQDFVFRMRTKFPYEKLTENIDEAEKIFFQLAKKADEHLSVQIGEAMNED